MTTNYTEIGRVGNVIEGRFSISSTWSNFLNFSQNCQETNINLTLNLEIVFVEHFAPNHTLASKDNKQGKNAQNYKGP